MAYACVAERSPHMAEFLKKGMSLSYATLDVTLRHGRYKGTYQQHAPPSRLPMFVSSSTSTAFVDQ